MRSLVSSLITRHCEAARRPSQITPSSLPTCWNTSKPAPNPPPNVMRAVPWGTVGTHRHRKDVALQQCAAELLRHLNHVTRCNLLKVMFRRQKQVD